MTQIHNCHSHIFTIKNVPEKFLPLRLVRFLAKKQRSRRFARLLQRIIPFSDHDLLDRYASFLRQGAQASQANVFEGLLKFYPDDAKFVVLSMDLDYMEAGKPQLPFEEQLKELAEVKATYKERIYPFIFADPRRPGLLDLVKRHIEEKGFKGIKLYPPLGYYPFDEGLYPVYEYAQQNEIPIMTHCARGGIYYRGKIPKAWLTHPKTGERFKKEKNKRFMNHFSDPDNYTYVLDDFNDLKLCLAHFGGDSEWELYQESEDPDVFKQTWYYKVKQLLKNKNYPNVFSDISYTLSDLKLLPLLKMTLLDNEVRDKVLFGSDFYMANIEGSEYTFSIKLRSELGEDDYKLIAETNPMRFL